MGKICSICGKPSGMYPLCLDCNKLKDQGKIIKCDVCGEWHYTDKPCSKCNPTTKRDNKSSNSPKITCLLCGEDSNGLHFCTNCYKKYYDKEILIKIKKFRIPCELMAEGYEGLYECDDGHIVKSQAEQTIDNWLFEEGIYHGYETPLDVDKDEPIKPDFCLKNYLGDGKDVYIEYFGMKGNPKYDEITNYKIPLYKKKKITLICLYPKTDLGNMRFALKTKLRKDKIKEGEIHYYQP